MKLCSYYFSNANKNVVTNNNYIYIYKLLFYYLFIYFNNILYALEKRKVI